MKLFKNLFLILTLTSVLISCSKDDDVHVPTNSEKIIGNWELNAYKSDGVETTTVGTEDPFETTISVNGKTFTDTFTKFTHPNTLESSGTYVLVTTTTIGETTEESEAALPFKFSGNWTIEGDKLTIKNGEDDEVFTIVELSETTLKLKRDTETTVEAGNTVVVETFTTNLSFTKK